MTFPLRLPSYFRKVPKYHILFYVSQAIIYNNFFILLMIIIYFIE